MNVIATNLPEVLVIETRLFGDDRGFFTESYNQRAFDDAIGYAVRFVQDNHSRSAKGVLRGLHYQLPPHTQGKLVRVTSGRIFDVAVDVRRHSPQFGKWAGMELSSENHRQAWVPPGFAHGFLVLSSSADVLYKTTDYYAPGAEASIAWNDAQLGIEWPLEGQDAVLSAKDAAAPSLRDAHCFD
jgi:dTDP-4-dehydrorhamnose 3,5-epimerase